MAKANPATMARADGRPRIYLKASGDGFYAAGSELGPWQRIDSLHDAIDIIAGSGASSRPAVLFWTIGD